VSIRRFAVRGVVGVPRGFVLTMNDGSGFASQPARYLTGAGPGGPYGAQ
jgi:hypothetical protein